MKNEIQPEKRERMPVAQFSIDMARHSIKGKKDGREPLTQEGMEEAVKSRLGEKHDQLGDIFGSPRERTSQSSLLRMFAERFKSVDFSKVDPEDIVRWLAEGGLKKVETPLLNFELGDGDLKKELMENFYNSQYFKWIVEKSDQRAEETKQNPEKVTPLSIQAGNVASFIFAEVWDQYSRLNGDEISPKGIDFATSHQSVLESFLYKVIKHAEGEAAAQTFVQSLNNQGFAENEGFKANIAIYNPHNPEDWEAVIDYKNKKYLLKPDEVVSIIKEGEDLKKKLAEGFEGK
jgi:hypothetical protein